MSRYKLTVAIPTYNRPKQLAHTLSVVLPQVLAHDEVQLLILDNCSPVPAVDVLNEIANGVALPERISVFRHGANIGGNGNILRCFELAEGEWLWCLGDDDDPAADAVDAALAHADCDDDIAYICYKINDQVPIIKNDEPEFVVGTSVSQWIKRIPSVGQRFFISSSLFRLSCCREYLRFGYMALASGGPHLFMAFLAVVNDKRRVAFSKQTLARFVMASETWNCLPIAFGMVELLSFGEGIVPMRDLCMFYSKGYLEWLTPRRILLQWAAQNGKWISVQSGRIYGSILNVFGVSLFRSGVKMCLECLACRLLAYFPRVYLGVVHFKELCCHRKYDRGLDRDV